ncbi:MAG TPA: efflux RND transporter periplasmic adaptor subunit [Desulfomonilaceae bacterium]|nr:efflux RND transporter periplasmic adaptor subunit [Desulfomonilaceae bacterium]
MTARGTPQQEQKAKPKPLVVTQTVELGELSSSMDLTGSVEATRVARLASPAEGPINHCKVREGDQVMEGGKILSIGRKKATEALLLSASQDVKTEQDDLARIEQLVESGAIPRDQLDVAKAKYHRAVAQKEKVKESSDDYEVVAPWDGTISRVLVADGNYVVPRTVMVEMFDPKSLVVRTAVPEAQSQDLRVDMGVSVKLDAYPGKNFQGQISRIYPELDRRMRTRTAEVELIDRVDLVPGMFARLTLKLKSEAHVVVVPSEAVIITPKGFRVAYVIEDGKAQQRKVTTGIEAAGKVQILSGIKPGDQIVVAGNEKLKDGLEIRLQGAAGDKDGPKGAPAKGVERR